MDQKQFIYKVCNDKNLGSFICNNSNYLNEINSNINYNKIKGNYLM